jgi:serine protease Do
VITAVAPDSVAEEAGVRPGDIIREIDRKPIGNLSDYKKIMASAVREKSVLFVIQRQGNTIFLALRREVG